MHCSLVAGMRLGDFRHATCIQHLIQHMLQYITQKTLILGHREMFPALEIP